MCMCIFVCIIHNGTLGVSTRLVSATKLYCLSSGKLPPCIEKTEDLKSTSKLQLTMSSFLSFLSAHYCVSHSF